MTASLSGVFNLQQFTDTGDLAAGHRLYTFAPATTTQKTAYTDAAATVPHSYTSDGIGGQYIALNARGELPAPLFLLSGGYDIALKTPAGATVWTRRAKGTDDNADTLRSDLANDSDSAKGSGIVGHDGRTAGAKLRERVSVDDKGGIGDGATNNVTAIAAAQSSSDEIVFVRGQYRIASNLSLTKTAVFQDGAEIVVPNGVTLTLAAEVVAGSYKIFTVEAGGAVVVSTTSTLSEIKGQWFDGAYTGASVIIRGELAGHAAVGTAGLLGLDYVHIDGYRACEKTTTGLEGMSIGTYAGASATSLLYNTLVGYAAGRGKESPPGTFRAWTGQDNTVVGAGSFVNPLTASSVTAIGSGVMKEFETGDNLVAVGTFAGRIGLLQKDGVNVGALSGYNAGTTGLAADTSDFVHVGFRAGEGATQSYRNTLAGSQAGRYLTTGAENTSIGALAGPENSTYGAVAKTIAVGSLARTRVSNSITIGNGITETVAGTTRIGGSDQTFAYVAGVYDQTTASAANVVVFSTGQLLRSTSSGSLKTAVEPMTRAWADRVLDLQPVYYRSLCPADNSDWGWYGLIAEDAAQVDPRFASWGRKELRDASGAVIKDPATGLATYEDQATPNGVPYERLVVNLIAVIKRHEQEINALKQLLQPE